MNYQKSEPENPSIPLGSGMSPREYWRKNITCVLWLLAIWFVVSYGCGILFADELDKFRTLGGGIKLGFWFAQQGSIYVFVLLIFYYAFKIGEIDKKYKPPET